ncbi:MAG: SIMPL domain-containing protein [Gemmatimonadaceae bacterium]
MNRSHFAISVAVAFALMTPLTPAAGQQAPATVPQVITAGRGEVDIKPDRVRMEFGVETRAASAAAAAAENSRRQRAVLDTLLKLGVGQDQIQTANLQVTPEMVYPGQGQPPKVSGYVARNSVRVEVLKLELAGVLVDAALAKGATNVMGLQFYSSRAAEARREALVRAVKAARLDAEAMALAAGYQLGALIEISSSGPSDGPMPMRMDMVRSVGLAAREEPTPVNPGELKVVETVSVRWAVKQ